MIRDYRRRVDENQSAAATPPSGQFPIAITDTKRISLSAAQEPEVLLTGPDTVSVMDFYDQIGPSRLSRKPNVDDTPAGDQLRTSERYQDNLRQQNEDGAREAQEGDTSFIATPDETLRQIDGKPPAIAPNGNPPLPPANTPVETEPPRTVVIDREQPVQQHARPTVGQPDAPVHVRHHSDGDSSAPLSRIATHTDHT